MTVNVKSSASRRRRRSPYIPWQMILDLLAIAAWSWLLLKYWITGTINVLLHPDYHWLAITAGIFLAILAVVKLQQIVQGVRSQRPLPKMPHTTLFPLGMSSTLLLGVAILGFIVTPRPFASDLAVQRGVADTLIMTRSQPQSFRTSTRPEERSVIDWVRTLNVYPEPDAYTGQPVRVEGFAVHSRELSDDYLTITRFVITCCAADVYPVGLPVKLPTNRLDYPADTWFRVEGEMITETLNGIRQLVIQATALTEIPEPANPYDY
ncbi:MAG TPA: TIGR03943 family protein [Candidatus Obscuribacterales bacterium]